MKAGGMRAGGVRSAGLVRPSPARVARAYSFAYPCALCNHYDAQSPGDLCARCSADEPVMCSRCGAVQEQYGPCLACADIGR